MYGWRTRIGLIVPSTNTVNESEWRANLPEGVSLHSARMGLEKANLDGLEGMSKEYARAAELLGTADVDVIAYGCTTGSLFKGHGFDEEIESTIGEKADAPGVATSAAIRRAFDALGMDSLAIATPYIDEMNDAEVEFLEDYGYEVANITGLAIDEPTEIGSQRPETAYKQVRDDVDHEAADGVFISCTDYRTFEIIDALEADLGVPVVSSNQATYWDALRNAGIDYEDAGPGQLFDH